MLTDQLLADPVTPAKGWQIRLIDASPARRQDQPARSVPAGFDLSAEHFGYSELSNERPPSSDALQRRVGSKTVYRNRNAVQTNPGHLCRSG